MSSKFLYPCTYVELGTKLEPLGDYVCGCRPIAVSHFASQTRMLEAGMEASFEHTVEQATRLDLISVTGPCVITNVRLGMHQVGDISSTFVAPHYTVELGHIVRITVKCMPELFMLPMVEELQAMQGVKHD